MSDYKWSGTVQYDGDDGSVYESVEFDITEQEFRQIKEAAASGKTLRECGLYEALADKMFKAFFDGRFGPEPDPESYDDPEAYKAELQEYTQEVEDFQAGYVLSSFSVEDPVENAKAEAVFKQKLIGRRSAELEQNETGMYEYQFETDVYTYSLTIMHDKQGVITDICNVYAEGLGWESETSSVWGPIEPNYDLIVDELEFDLELSDPAEDSDAEEGNS